MEVVLLVQSRNSGVKSLRLKGDTLVGRGSECQLRVTSTEVSRRHCLLRLTDHGVMVRDLRSSNGTLVDGSALPPEVDVSVAPGASLVVGPFRCTIEFSPPIDRPNLEPGVVPFSAADNADSAIELPAADDSAIELPAADDPAAPSPAVEPPVEDHPVDAALEDFFRSI